jgi:hypothetical protein
MNDIRLNTEQCNLAIFIFGNIYVLRIFGNFKNKAVYNWKYYVTTVYLYKKNA